MLIDQTEIYISDNYKFSIPISIFPITTSYAQRRYPFSKKIRCHPLFRCHPKV